MGAVPSTVVANAVNNFQRHEPISLGGHHITGWLFNEKLSFSEKTTRYQYHYYLPYKNHSKKEENRDFSWYLNFLYLCQLYYY